MFLFCPKSLPQHQLISKSCILFESDSKIRFKTFSFEIRFEIKIFVISWLYDTSAGIVTASTLSASALSASATIQLMQFQLVQIQLVRRFS